jgi:predicted glycosyltransferase
MRILHYAINGTGLGHVARLANIASGVRALDPEVHQLVVTNSSYLDLLKRQGLPFAVIPSNDGEVLSGLDRRSRSVTRRTAYAMLYRLIGEYDPALVVFDTHAPPQLVRRLADEGRAMALVLRRVREAYLGALLADGLLSRFAAVVVPHTREEFCSGLGEPTLQALASLPKLRFVGPVVRPVTPEARRGVVARYGLDPRRRLVVVTCGAGGYVHQSEELIRKSCAAALRLRDSDPSLEIIVVGGPHGSALPVAGCRSVDSEPELPALYGCAHLVITHGGYNSVHETLQSGARALFVPMHRQNESQAERVYALRDAGRAHAVELDADEAQFFATVRAAFDSPAPRPLALDGRSEAARTLHALLPLPERLALAGVAAVPRGWRRLGEAELGAQLHTAATRALLVDDAALPRLLRAAQGPAVAAATWIIALPDGDVPSLVARATNALARLREAGVEPNRIVLALSDERDGATLLELARALSTAQLRALVALVPVAGDAAARFAALERCRNAGLPFKVDMTSADDPVLLVDQP